MKLLIFTFTAIFGAIGIFDAQKYDHLDISGNQLGCHYGGFVALGFMNRELILSPMGQD